ncbi:MAG: TonB-dependent receptor, partial [Candidatus Binatia bacterium]
VLKGPQGTLFGRNTTGGAMLIKTQEPTGELEGKLAVTGGSRNLRVYEGMLNIPVSDVFKVRLAGKMTEQDGYTDNVMLHKELDNLDNHGFRISMLFEPTDNFSNNLTYSNFKDESAASGNKLVAARENGLVNNTVKTLAGLYALTGSPRFAPFATGKTVVQAANDPSLSFHEVRNDRQGFVDLQTHNVSNTTIGKLGDITIKNILGYYAVTLKAFNDLDGSEFPMLWGGTDSHMDQYSEEFLVSGSSFEDRLDWIAGTYLFRESGADTGPASFFNAVVSDPSVTGGDVENTSYSAFAQATYHFKSIDGLALTGGARYTKDDRSVDFRQYNVTASGGLTCRMWADDAKQIPISDANCAVSANTTFKRPTYLLSLSYQINPETMVYGKYSSGYRSGGYNIRAELPVSREPFKPETIDDFEIGIKSDWNLAGMPGRTNIAVYYDKYEEIQRLIILPGATTSVPTTSVLNAGKATIYGGELEFTLFPTDHLELSGYVAYSRPEYDEFVDGAGIDQSNNEFSYAPRKQASLTARYTLPLDSSFGDISLQANIFYQDDIWTSDINEPEGRLPSYSVVNLAADWKNIMTSDFDASLFVKNAGDKEYYDSQFTVEDVVGLTANHAAPPREVGVQITYRFK